MFKSIIAKLANAQRLQKTVNKLKDDSGIDQFVEEQLATTNINNGRQNRILRWVIVWGSPVLNVMLPGL